MLLSIKTFPYLIVALFILGMTISAQNIKATYNLSDGVHSIPCTHEGDLSAWIQTLKDAGFTCKQDMPGGHYVVCTNLKLDLAGLRAFANTPGHCIKN